MAVTRAATSKRPSGNDAELEYDAATERAKVTVIVTEAPLASVPADGPNVKNDGCAEAIFHGTAEALGLVSRKVAVVPVVEKSRAVALTPSATRAEGLVVVARGIVVVAVPDETAVEGTFVCDTGVDDTGVDESGVGDTVGGGVGNGVMPATVVIGVSVDVVSVDVTGDPSAMVIDESLFAESLLAGAESVLASMMTEPVAKIGRASCRERVFRSVLIAGGGGAV